MDEVPAFDVAELFWRLLKDRAGYSITEHVDPMTQMYRPEHKNRQGVRGQSIIVAREGQGEVEVTWQFGAPGALLDQYEEAMFPSRPRKPVATLGVLTVDEAHEKISEMVSEGATAAKRRIARER